MSFQSTLEQWRTVFWIVFGVFIVTNCVFVIWASGEEQWWNDISKFGYPPNWKYNKSIEVEAVQMERGKDSVKMEDKITPPTDQQKYE